MKEANTPNRLERQPGNVTLEQVVARLERLPMTWALWRIVLVAGLAWLVESLDIGAMSVILPILQKVMSLNAGQVGILAVASTVGIVVGLIPAGRLADRFSRRSVLVAGVLTYSLLTALAALSPNYAVLVALRFAAGLGMGAVFPLPYAMVGELVARDRRTWFSGILDACLSAGYFVAPVLGLVVVPHFPPALAWRVFLILAGLPVFYVLLVRRYVPESPRWLAERRRFEEADAVLRHLEAESERRSGRPLSEAQPVVAIEPAPAAEVGGSPWSRPYIGRTVVSIAGATGAFFMFYVVMTYMPLIFAHQGFSYAKSFAFAAVITAGAIPGKLLNGYLAEVWGRKWIFGVFMGLAAVGALLFAVATTPTGMLAYAVAMSFFGTGAFPVIKMYYAEQYPTALRAAGSATVEAVGRFLGGVVGPVAMPLAWQVLGLTSAFRVIAATALAAVVVLALWGIESRGLSLEAIQARYRRGHWKKASSTPTA